MAKDRVTALVGILGISLALFVGCGGSSDGTRFHVNIENVSKTFNYFASGAFTTPVGETTPAPIAAGRSYTFRVAGVPGTRLSFATMYVQSNDLFFAPDGNGIPLFDGQGNPVAGDLTASAYLWDAGTEKNETPGLGPNQAPRQSGPDTGPQDPEPAVRMVNDGFAYMAVPDLIQVSIQPEGGNEFTVTITNVSGATPLAPGVYVVHNGPDPLFQAGTPDRGKGLEALAEDGDPMILAANLDAGTGLTSPFAPGVWALHRAGMPVFSEGIPDRGKGLEALAEDGNPTQLASTLLADTMVSDSGVFDTPDGAMNAGPILPGMAYSFSLRAVEGDRLSFATMLVQSNDLFISPHPDGISLFGINGEPVQGDVTANVSLWDAGTENNQWPGAGPDQAPRQAEPNTGAPDGDNTVRPIQDGFVYPEPAQLLRITIVPNP